MFLKKYFQINLKLLKKSYKLFPQHEALVLNFTNLLKKFNQKDFLEEI